MTGTQSPLFKKRPELLQKIVAAAPRSMPERRVMPQAIFAASRKSFDCIVLGATSINEAIAWIKADLPLEANGWNLSAARFKQTEMSFGERTFRVERG